jgi:hypothetical protein
MLPSLLLSPWFVQSNIAVDPSRSFNSFRTWPVYFHNIHQYIIVYQLWVCLHARGDS